ncbi:MAG: sulfur carrier protein ThiS [Candidatus Krumholzibacteriota bacterium]|nr:sulfur carrier protein ThiS [Candidatus Krumholzibacteriota bacterium]
MIVVNDRDRVPWREGMTVQDLLDAMGYDYVLITVTVDGRLVPDHDYASRRLEDGAKVGVFHLAHGG